jgi:hypothetical protein
MVDWSNVIGERTLKATALLKGPTHGTAQQTPSTNVAAMHPNMSTHIISISAEMSLDKKPSIR